eukprot:TRINITY_DN8358_c0_g1_i1.p1 TRINITY_DN8358_c0_g1~~TRINITY_DN8358_c0_g1_i1.p1  ORF type:complete len:1011 (-),score=162.52 TRINITY_DN8358_c0_g1_i1:103-2766(-)
MNQHLRQAESMMERGAFTSARTHLQEARDGLQEVHAQPMMKALPSMRASIEHLEKAESAYAHKALASEAKDIVQQGKVLLGMAKTFERVGARSKAIGELNEAVKVSAELRSNHLFMTLPSVSEFITELEALAGKLEVQVGQGETAAAGPSSAGGATVTGIVGGLFPHPSLRIASFTISTALSPKVFGEIKKLNELGSRINARVREAFRIVKALPMDDNTASLKAVSPFEIDTARYPIEGIERLQVDMRKFVTDPLQKLGAAEEDEDAKKAVQAVNTFNSEWKETVERWKTAFGICEKMRTNDDLFHWIAKALEEFKGAMATSSGSGWTFHVATKTSTWDRTTPLQVTDASACLEILSLLDRIERNVDQLKADHGAYPGEEQVRERVSSVRSFCTLNHPKHCIFMLLNLAGNCLGARGVYWKALRRFPKARSTVLDLWELKTQCMFERRWHDKDKDFSDWELVDPFRDLTLTNAFDETNAVYDERTLYDWIRPNSPDAECRVARSMKDSKLWSSLHSDHAGKIAFSTAPIENTCTSTSDFSNEFKGSDSIYARAYWPKAISQIALAKNKETGELVFGPQYLTSSSHGHRHLVWLEIVQMVKIDGEAITRPDQPEGMFSWFSDNGVQFKSEKEYEAKLGTVTDFYAFNQSCRFPVSQKKVPDISDEWERASNRYQFALHSLPAGKHTVSVDLCFRVCSSMDNYPGSRKPVFPMVSTAISHPLASGEFVIDTAAAPVTIASLYPKRRTSLSSSTAQEYEHKIMALLQSSCGWGKRSHKTEVPLYVALEGDWYCSGTNWYLCGDVMKEEPTEYSIAFIALFYRSPQSGWNREEIAAFHLSAVTQCGRGMKPSPPFAGFAVGSSFTFDVDLLPPAALAKFQRCPEHLRKGVF